MRSATGEFAGSAGRIFRGMRCSGGIEAFFIVRD